MEGVGPCIMLYSPMSHGAHTLLYNPITHGAHASLYNPMTHGDLYPLYNVVWPHDPWGFVTIATPVTHGKKVAEPCAVLPDSSGRAGDRAPSGPGGRPIAVP